MTALSVLKGIGYSAGLGHIQRHKEHLYSQIGINVDYFGGLEKAIAEIGASNATILINSTQTLTANATIPANIMTFAVQGAHITGSFALAVNGQLIAPPMENLFDSTVTVTMGDNVVTECLPEWFYSGSGSYSSAIDAAIDSGIKRIFFTQDEYVCAETMTLKSDIIMYGNFSTIKIDDNADVTLFYSESANDNIEIYNLIFDGNKANNTKGAWPLGIGGCLIINDATNIRIHNNIFKNFFYGITASGENTARVIITENGFVDCTDPIDTYGAAYVITDNVITGGTGTAIQLEPIDTSGLIDETVPYDANWTDVATLALESVISGNTIRGEETMQHGILLQGGTAGVSITGNSIANTVLSGIQSAQANVKGLVINGNTIRNVSGGSGILPWTTIGSGINLASSLGAIVSDNTIEYCWTGIYVNQGARYIISNNTISFCNTSGITLDTVSGGQVIANFTLDNNWTETWAGNSGIILRASDKVIFSENRDKDTNGFQGAAINFNGALNTNIQLGINYTEDADQYLNDLDAYVGWRHSPVYGDQAGNAFLDGRALIRYSLMVS